LAQIRVWTAVLYAALAMPLLGWLIPALPFPLPMQTSIHISYQSAAGVAIGMPKPSSSLDRNSAGLATEKGGGIAGFAPTSSRTMVPRGFDRGSNKIRLRTFASLSSKRTRRTYQVPWAVIVAAVYVVITFVFLFRFLLGVLLSRRLNRDCKTIDEPRALQRLASYCRATGLRLAPRLAESGRVSVPLTVGVARPLILFPADWREWDDDTLDAVMVHELSHVTRRDTLTEQLSLIYRVILWFSPLSWWLHHRLCELAEQVSDEAALASGADRRRYAETLLNLFARLEAAPGRVRWQGVFMARAGQAEKRVDRILAWRGSMSSKAQRSIALCSMLLAIPAVYVAAAARPSITGRQAAPSHPASPQTPAVPATPVGPGLNGVVSPSAIPEVPPVPGSQSILPGPAPAPQSRALPQAAPVVAPVPEPAPAPRTPSHRAYSNSNDDQRYAVSSWNSTSMTGSFNQKDLEHIQALRAKIKGDFIWFEHDGKPYIIRDQATVDRAKQLFLPREALGQNEGELRREQDELEQKQEELERKQEELGKKMSEVRVKIPDLAADLQKLEAKIKELRSEGTEEDLSEIQEQLGDLQSKIGEIQVQAAAGRGQIGEQMGELGRLQGELGRQQGELARQQGELARKDSSEMKSLLDDALARGLAQPE
jgi:beta-lactamase regulating signal transducer with metallopeptidase domain